MGIDDDAGVGVDLDLDLHMGFEFDLDLDLDVESLGATKLRHAQRRASSGDSKVSLEATKAWQA